jgi:hypothetical protein
LAEALGAGSLQAERQDTAGEAGAAQAHRRRDHMVRRALGVLGPQVGFLLGGEGDLGRAGHHSTRQKVGYHENKLGYQQWDILMISTPFMILAVLTESFVINGLDIDFCGIPLSYPTCIFLPI